jgi:hypothetical protein
VISLELVGVEAFASSRDGLAENGVVLNDTSGVTSELTRDPVDGPVHELLSGENGRQWLEHVSFGKSRLKEDSTHDLFLVSLETQKLRLGIVLILLLFLLIFGFFVVTTGLLTTTIGATVAVLVIVAKLTSCSTARPVVNSSHDREGECQESRSRVDKGEKQLRVLEEAAVKGVQREISMT